MDTPPSAPRPARRAARKAIGTVETHRAFGCSFLELLFSVIQKSRTWEYAMSVVTKGASCVYTIMPVMGAHGSERADGDTAWTLASLDPSRSSGGGGDVDGGSGQGRNGGGRDRHGRAHRSWNAGNRRVATGLTSRRPCRGTRLARRGRCVVDDEGLRRVRSPGG